jgi:predicted metal-binding protein
MSGPRAGSPCGIVLSVCIRCKDGREEAHGEVRGGARLARAVAAAVGADREILARFETRGVRCMSQCKRACTVSITAPGAFTWLFGDLDPERHAEDVLALVRLYAGSPAGFMARCARPEPMRAGVLGRLPPIGSTHEIVEPLVPDSPETYP